MALTGGVALALVALAGLATGFWKSTAELATQYHVERRFKPAAPTDRMAERKDEWARAVERAKGWAA
jgi:glycerol kinase